MCIKSSLRKSFKGDSKSGTGFRCRLNRGLQSTNQWKIVLNKWPRNRERLLVLLLVVVVVVVVAVVKTRSLFFVSLAFNVGPLQLIGKPAAYIN